MKKFLIGIICLLVFCMALAGCNFNHNTNGEVNNKDNNSANSNENDSEYDIIRYMLIGALDSSVISNYFETGATIHTNDNGAVTMLLNKPYSEAAFSWDLSTYSFKTNKEYLVEFKNLSISGIEPELKLFLKLQWQDTSYNFLRYYHTDTSYFTTSVDNNHYGLHLDSLTYETYSFSFKFSHTGVTTSNHNILYLSFQGIESGGLLSFDSLSIYERQ